MENEQSLEKPGMSKKEDRGEAKVGAPPAKKMTGVGFYIVLAIVAINDVAGLIADSTIVFFLIPVFTGLIAQLVTFTYLYWSGVKMADRKLAIILVSSTIEVLPFVNLLPAGTLNLIAIRTIENSNAAKKFADRGKK